VWHSYPTDLVCPEIPSWEMARAMQGEDEDEAHGIPYDPAQLYERKRTDAFVDALPDR
jgi:hypothetical protein